MSYKWIKKSAAVNKTEIKEFAVSELPDGTYIAIYTDKVECGLVIAKVLSPDITDTGHLLELRIFNDNAEFRAYRSIMGNEFKCRVADDEYFKSNLNGSGFDQLFYNRIYDEKHYLDIDKNKTTEMKDGYTCFTTTGGGKYTLPVKADKRRIKLRNYINYSPETGNLQIADQRAVEFLTEDK